MSTTLPNGLVIPDATATDDVPGVLLGLFTAAQLQMIPRFANAGARSAAYPTVAPGSCPPLTIVDSPGRIERIVRNADGSWQWAPLPGTREALLTNAPASTPSTPVGQGSVTQATLAVTIPALPYPRRANIVWQVGTLSDDSGASDVFLTLAGTQVAVATVVGTGTGGNTYPYDVPPNTAVQVLTFVKRTAGGANTAATNDAQKTFVRIDVAAA